MRQEERKKEENYIKGERLNDSVDQTITSFIFIFY